MHHRPQLRQPRATWLSRLVPTQGNPSAAVLLFSHTMKAIEAAGMTDMTVLVVPNKDAPVALAGKRALASLVLPSPAASPARTCPVPERMSRMALAGSP